MSNVAAELEGLTPFLQNLWTMLGDSSISHIISWADDGLSFQVLDKPLFESVVLPRYFKHHKFTSFVRQVNMYEMKKFGEPYTWQWRHKFVQRGKPHLLKLVQRKASDSDKNSVKFPQEHLAYLSGEMDKLREENSARDARMATLESTNKDLLAQVQRMNTELESVSAFVSLAKAWCQSKSRFHPLRIDSGHNMWEETGNPIKQPHPDMRVPPPDLPLPPADYFDSVKINPPPSPSSVFSTSLADTPTAAFSPMGPQPMPQPRRALCTDSLCLNSPLPSPLPSASPLFSDELELPLGMTQPGSIQTSAEEASSSWQSLLGPVRDSEPEEPAQPRTQPSSLSQQSSQQTQQQQQQTSSSSSSVSCASCVVPPASACVHATGPRSSFSSSSSASSSASCPRSHAHPHISSFHQTQHNSSKKRRLPSGCSDRDEEEEGCLSPCTCCLGASWHNTKCIPIQLQDLHDKTPDYYEDLHTSISSSCSSHSSSRSSTPLSSRSSNSPTASTSSASLSRSSSSPDSPSPRHSHDPFPSSNRLSANDLSSDNVLPMVTLSAEESLNARYKIQQLIAHEVDVNFACQQCVTVCLHFVPPPPPAATVGEVF